MTRDPVNKPLRILAILNLPWDARLGAARVWIELTEEWRKAGHSVEKFCLTDAFPRPTASRGLSAFRQAIFPYHAAAYLKRNAARFDIIDCLIGTLPDPKSSLGFKGLLVARSVGLHRLYDRFHELSRERWPDQPKGRFLGSLFYRLRAWRLRKNADDAIRCCDLLNLPNETEKQELKINLRIHKPAIVRPYGLNDRYRKTFEEAAQPAALRLGHKKICFIGMWSLRKGSRDWPKIVRHIWEQVPNAKFAFLGTMTGEKEILTELGLQPSERLLFVSSYDPANLPQLLSDCTVGLFPSYIEGFGLAILEQLAAGIPTVAYDVPGPRQILEPQKKILLTPEGNPAAMAGRAVEILKMQPRDYENLSAQCISLAGQYRWSEIAAETMRQYRTAHERLSQVIVFTHPFSLAAAGGGPRILRSLLKDAPVPAVCVCTTPGSLRVTNLDSELHLPIRPSLGRIERTRFNSLAHAIAPLFQHRFTKRLERIVTDSGARAIHSIAHGGLDFYSAFVLAKKLQIPFFLQVHDDVAYTGAGRVPARTLSQCVSEAWQGAAARFVISSELGAEYTSRYGKREFTTVTDGVERVAARPRAGMKGLRIYFMGLFHIGYEKNLEALIKALDLLPRNLTSNSSITLRCDYLRPAMLRQSPLLRVLPFGSEADVEADLVNADCLYLPLHFGEADRPFGAYSLSTKMVTYLGSGIPILYHGPTGTAAYNMLEKHGAAALATSLDPKEIAAVLAELFKNNTASHVARNALRLAREEFLRSDQHSRFWQKVMPFLAQSGRELEPHHLTNVLL